MDIEYKEWTLDELTEKRRAVRDGGQEVYLKTYKQLLDAQNIYLAHAKLIGLHLGYIGGLFGRCHDAFTQNNTEAMKSAAAECGALDKLEDAAGIGEHPELNAPATRIVQLSYILKG